MLSLLVALCSSASPVLLQDIAPSAAVDSETYLEVDTGADPNLLVIENDFWGAELFTVLDGRRTLVIDLCPGQCSGNPQQLTRAGGHVLFVGNDQGGAPTQLWVTDGSATGTVKLADGVVAVPRLTPLDRQVLFMKGADLWVTDGTVGGTEPLSWGANRQLSSAQLTPQHRFVAVNRPSGCELYATGPDVRQATALPMPAPSEQCLEPIAALAERAFASFSTGLWRFDATPLAAVRIDATGTNLARAGGGLFFFRSAAPSLSLFHSTGESGTTLALGSVPGTAVRLAASTGQRLVYSAIDPAGATRLYASDGTLTGTAELGIVAGDTLAILALGPVAYVVTGVVIAGALRTELIETDGTPSGTVVLQGVHPAHRQPQPAHREATAHTLAIAVIAFVVNEFGAFRIRPGEEPQTIFLQPANPRGSTPTRALARGGDGFFNAGRVFRTDGTEGGTSVFADGGLVGFAGSRVLVSEGSALTSISVDGGDPVSILSGPSLFPSSIDLGETTVVAVGTNPRSLFRTDGTAAGTAELVTMGNGAFADPFKLENGLAVFTVAQTLWFTDGTPAGTSAVVVPGLKSSVPGSDVAWASTTDGLSRVTPRLNITVPGWPEGLPIQLLTARGDEVFGVVEVGNEVQLWRASPTLAGKLTALKAVRALTIYRGRLMVLGDRGEGLQLLEWEANQLKVRAPARGATFLRAVGDRLYADVATAAQGQELHYFHEAFGLMLQISDLSPGPGSSSPSAPIALGSRILFAAWSPDTGREPWSWTPEPLPPSTQPRGCGCTASDGAGLLALLGLWTLILRAKFPLLRR